MDGGAQRTARPTNSAPPRLCGQKLAEMFWTVVAERASARGDTAFDSVGRSTSTWSGVWRTPNRARQPARTKPRHPTRNLLRPRRARAVATALLRRQSCRHRTVPYTFPWMVLLRQNLITGWAGGPLPAGCFRPYGWRRAADCAPYQLCATAPRRLRIGRAAFSTVPQMRDRHQKATKTSVNVLRCKDFL